MIRISSLLLALAILAVIAAAQEQDPWAKYKPRTLSQVVKAGGAKVLNNPDLTIQQLDDYTAFLVYQGTPSQSKVIYTGLSRALSEKRKKIITMWVKAVHGPNSGLEDLFEKEYLFIENGVNYWLPVQKQVSEYFPDELEKNDKIVIFTSWIGAVKESDKIDWLFLVNEFEKE